MLNFDEGTIIFKKSFGGITAIKAPSVITVTFILPKIGQSCPKKYGFLKESMWHKLLS